MSAALPERPPRRDAGMGAATLLELSHLSVRRGAEWIVEDVSLSVSRGEIVTLIGPNGCGKTTLVRAALGLIRIDAGSTRRAEGIRVGYVPQHLTIDGTLPLSVRRFMSLSRAATPAAIERVLGEVGALHVVDAPLQHVSGGETKRVLLARALLHRPDLLVLDEPSAGVDVTGQAELYALIQSIRSAHECGVLLVSHDLHLVMAATDRVVCLNHHVCCVGEPAEVAHNPEYLALFGADLGDRLAVYAHDHDHRHDLHGRVEPESTTAGDGNG